MDIGTVFTIISGVAGLAGLIVSLFAKSDSKRANNIAQRSEKLSTESNLLARESNSIAIDARQLAEEANTISLRAEQRDTEINDVSWNYDWVNPGTCKITNTGNDKALGVTVRLAVNGDYIQSSRRDVSPGGYVILVHQPLANELASRREKFLAEQRAYDERAKISTGFGSIYSGGIPPVKFPLHARVHINIRWTTLLGKQREKAFEDLNAKLSF